MTKHESWHPEAFLQNRYTRAYRALVERALSENRVCATGVYDEHHIVPKSFYRSYCDDGWLDGDWHAPNNRVLLTHQEHARAHIWLSRRMTKGLAKRKMATSTRFYLDALKATGKSYRLCSRAMAEILGDHARAMIDTHADPIFKEKHRTACVIAHADPVVKTKRRQAAKRRADEPGFVDDFVERMTSKEIAQKRQAAWERQSTRESHRQGVIAALADPTVKARQRERTKEAVNQPEIKARRKAAQKVMSDPCIYHWQHKDGRTFVGTRWELEEREGLKPCRLLHLTMTNGHRRETVLGWSMIRHAEGEL